MRVSIKQLAIAIILLVMIILIWRFGLPFQANNEAPIITEQELDAKIKTSWNRQKNQYQTYLTESLKNDDLEVLYTTELALHNLVEYARQRNDGQLLRDIIAINQPALDKIQVIDGQYKWICGEPCSSIGLAGQEYLLASSQYLYLHASLLNGLSALTNDQLTAKDKLYMEKITPILQSHYERWILGPSVYNSWWSDCAPYQKFNYSQILDWKLAEPQHGLFYEYCKATHDVEMLIAGGVIELIGANRNLSTIIKLDPTAVEKLRTYPILFSQLLQSRLQVTQLVDPHGVAKQGLVLDPGYYRLHPNWEYAGYTGEKFPEKSDKKIVDNVTWDISHYRRLVHLYNSYRRHQELLGLKFPSALDMERQINQFAYAVYNQDPKLPLFKTFTDGSNGWYRVNYEGQKGFGYPPFSQSIYLAQGGYGFWAADHAAWRQIMIDLYKYMNDPKSPDLAKHYWLNDDRGSRDWEDLYFLPSLISLTKPFPRTPSPLPKLPTSRSPAAGIPEPKNSPVPSPVANPVPSQSSSPTNLSDSSVSSVASSIPIPVSSLSQIVNKKSDKAINDPSSPGVKVIKSPTPTTKTPVAKNTPKIISSPVGRRIPKSTMSPETAITDLLETQIEDGQELSKLGFIQTIILGGRIIYGLLFGWLF